MAVRNEFQLLPEFSAELEEIRENGISIDLIYKIIQKHRPNALYNKGLYNRYLGIDGYTPIFNRKPKYEEETNPINNQVNNDFVGEIVNFTVGYFAGEPISYSYSSTDEAEEETGGENGVDEAKKTLTDFVTRNNMFGVDMETTKNAAMYGYSGRLFYIDKEGNERVMAVPGYETIILSDTGIYEPEYAIRYYSIKDINGAEKWIVNFYDNKNITTYEGELYSLVQKEIKPHLFDYCPLQGILYNPECIGDVEKVLPLIDDYNKVMSDNSNEAEAFAHAMLLVNLHMDDDELNKAQKSGCLIIPPSGATQNSDPVKWLTKNIDDAFTEHHLQRIEDNIYRFSNTPNLKDPVFGSSSGVALKFKLHGLETKCATYEACVMNSAQYMWKVLCSSWAKKGKKLEPLQICMEFRRNFPLDSLSEAQTAQARIAAGLPKEWVFSKMPDVDDVDYIMSLIEKETQSMSLYSNSEKTPQDRLYKYQINMVQEYADKIKNGEMSEEAAMKLLKRAISLPEDDIRDLLGLGAKEGSDDEIEKILKSGANGDGGTQAAT